MFADSAFARLLPAQCIAVDACEDSWWSGGLFQEECPYVKQTVEKRRREFTAGRNCARAALVRLGFPPVPIGVGEYREPLFPAGVSGSITHSGNHCSAAVVRIGTVRTIGIDVEANNTLDYEVAQRVLNPRELLRAGSYSQHNNCCAKVLMFSLKEAFFKAAFPIYKRYIDFNDVDINFSLVHGLCDIQVLKPDLVACIDQFCIDAKYWFDDNYIYSAITLLEGRCQFNPT